MSRHAVSQISQEEMERQRRQALASALDAVPGAKRFWDNEIKEPPPPQMQHGGAGVVLVQEQPQTAVLSVSVAAPNPPLPFTQDTANALMLPPNTHYGAEERAKEKREQRMTEIDSKIVRVDGKFLSEPAHALRLAHVLEHARDIIARIGVERVHRLYIHANANVIMARDGRWTLTGVVIIVAPDAAVSVIPADWGAACTMSIVKPGPGGAVPVDVGIANMHKIRYEPHAHDHNRDRARYVDEGLLDMTFDNQPSDAPWPTLAYTGAVRIIEGYDQVEGVQYFITACNHSPHAVKHARRLASKHKLSVGQFYHSLAYRSCVAHGALQCAAMSRVLADAMNMVPKKALNIALDDHTQVPIAVPDTYAPETYIRPVRVPYDDHSDTVAYEVHLGTMGEYHNAVPKAPIEYPNNKHVIEHHGYIIHDAPLGSFSVMKCFGVADLHEEVWTGARLADVRLVQAELEKGGPDMNDRRDMILLVSDVHRGYPCTGMYDALHDDRTPNAFRLDKKVASVVGYAGHVQVWQVSPKYTPLLGPTRLLSQTPYAQKVLTLQKELVCLDPHDSKCMHFTMVGKIRALYVGGLNTHGAHAIHMVLTLCPRDYIDIPLSNTDLYREVTELALRFRADVAMKGTETSIIKQTHAISNGIMLTQQPDAVNPYWFDLCGGAVDYHPSLQVLRVDLAWLLHAIRTFEPRLLPSIVNVQ